MISPWYRSRLFWFGLLGLLFLLWGWADWGLPSSLTAKLGNSRLVVGNQAGTLRIAWQSDPASPAGFTISGHTGTRAPDHIRLFPPAFRHSEVNLSAPFGGGHSTIRIAYWFLVLIYLPIWLVALAGWQRDRDRRVKLSNPPMG
jgi:hypothetical protein